MADSFFELLLLGLPIVGIYLYRTRLKADGSKSSEIEVIGAENKNTVLFGTPPHEMEGRLSDRLRSLMALPSEGHREEPPSSEGLLKLFERSRTQPRVSVLRIFEDIENERTSLSFRADFAGPSDAHVSQGAWNDDGDYYDLDEWVFKDEILYQNAGLWMEMRDEDTVTSQRSLTSTLRPQVPLEGELPPCKMSSRIAFEGKDYRVVHLEPQVDEQTGGEVRIAIWIQEKTGLLAKATTDFFENQKCAGRVLSTFVYDKKLRIELPKWLNMDGSGKITNASICAVAHP